MKLDNWFARDLAPMALPWQAEEQPAPQVVVLNEALAVELGLDVDWLRSPAGVRFLIGVELPEGATPVAQAYSGHQFGGFSPQLGDGRALLLGELDGPTGPVDVHLKGSGRTPFSRGGDGRAVLGPMLREYLVSEAMHALGVPTTRSLAVVATGRQVRRESDLPGAVLTRTASSHLRVGSFQFARVTGDLDLLRALADHAITRHHPHAADAPEPYLALYEAVLVAQARLVARWMGVGFIHGVMNTDNVTISGETIDYGPCAFLEGYDPAAVFSSIDHEGRYAYGNQPTITQWNLARFAEALLPLFADDEQSAIAKASGVLNTFADRFRAAWTDEMARKLAVPVAAANKLATDLLDLLAAGRTDFTQAFRALVDAAEGDTEPLRSKVLDLPATDEWLLRWRAHQPDAEALRRANPVHIPRNHLLDEALAAAEGGDLAPFEELLSAVQHPFDEHPGMERYAAPAPEGFTDGFRTFCGT